MYRLTHRFEISCYVAVEGLDLALLVNTKHQGVFRRVEVKTDNIFQLLNKMRIVRQFECFDQVRF